MRPSAGREPGALVVRLGCFSVVLIVALARCTSPPPQHVPPDVTIPPDDSLTALAYPTVNELWGGAQGIYRGCGPNGNVCHNARQYPNMNSLGALVWNIGRPCNLLQDDPTRIDDWCERAGDTATLGSMEFQLAYIALVAQATDMQGSQWRVVLDGAAPMLDGSTDLAFVRNNAEGHRVTLLHIDSSELSADPSNPNAILVQLTLDDTRADRTLQAAGVVGNPDAIQFGDPNRNGVFGATTGTHLLIDPGHPESSYIIKRLTDPSAGPLMPLANCCFWTKTSLRALWCWINSLEPDGSNALDPIDYGRCPPGPMENVIYPEPGPTCESAGVCPVRAAGDIPSDPTWENVYDNILTNRCAGGGCHFDMASGGLNMRTSQTAYDSLLNSTPPRVIPGDPNMSLMYARLTQTCAPGTTCLRMPLGRPALPDNELMIIRNWIVGGALMNGTADGGTADASTDAAMDAATDVGSETGPVDAGMESAVESGTDAGMDVSPPVDAGSDAAVDVVDEDGGG